MSFERFALSRDMKDEASELSSAGKVKGLAGSLGGVGGALLAPLLFNPVGLAATAAVAGLGAIGGNIIGRNVFAPKATKTLSGKDSKFYGDEREEFRQNLNADMLTSSITSALTAGGSEFLKGWGKLPATYDETLVKQAGELGIEGVEVGDKISVADRIKLSSGGEFSVTNPLSKEGVIGSKMVDDKGLFQGGDKGRFFGRGRDAIGDLFSKDSGTGKIASNTVSKKEITKPVKTITSKVTEKVNDTKSSLDDLWDEVKLGKLRDKERNRLQNLFSTDRSNRY